MAVIIKKKIEKLPSKTVAPQSSGFSFTLPSDMLAPPETLLGYSTLIYGEAGVGKTSLVSSLGEALGGKVLMYSWEAADESIRSYRTPPLANDIGWKRGTGISGWGKALAVTEALESTGKKDGYVAVCFDTARPAYDRCLEYVCDREHIQHPGEQDDYGASWGKVRSEFEQLYERIRAAGFATFTITHQAIEPQETRSGKKFHLVRPAVGQRLLEYYKQSTAIVGYYYKVGQARYLQIAGDDYILAKSNPEGHFNSIGGERIERIPMSTSSKLAAASFIRAFDSKQKGTYDEAAVYFVAEANKRTGKFGKAVMQTRKE